jgi:hypothetical protein
MSVALCAGVEEKVRFGIEGQGRVGRGIGLEGDNPASGRQSDGERERLSGMAAGWNGRRTCSIICGRLANVEIVA